MFVETFFCAVFVNRVINGGVSSTFINIRNTNELKSELDLNITMNNNEIIRVYIIYI